MTAVTFKGFRGAIPRAGERLQQPRFASIARGVKITSGNIEPLKGMQQSATLLSDAIKTIWRYRYRSAVGAVSDNWLSFDSDTDVVGSLIANDEQGRVYWSSADHEPRMSVFDEIIDGAGPYPNAWYMLGVPSPDTAPTLVADVNAGTITAALANTPSAGKVRVTFNTVEGLAIGDPVTFAGVVGMTALNTTLVVESIAGLDVVFPLVTSQVYTSGGTWSRDGIAVTRSYAFTFATALGEESGPSPACEIRSGLLSGVWALSGMQTAPANSGTASAWSTLPNGRIQATLNTAFGMQVGSALLMTYDTVELASPIVETVRLLAVNTSTGVVEFDRGGAYPAGTTPTLAWARTSPINTVGMVKRIYRTEGASAAFLFVAEIPVATTTYNDTAVLLTGEVIRTLNTLPPRARLTNLIALPNGCLVGLNGNEVCFSDPYMPYSWPVGNRYSFTGNGVALGKVGNSVIVLTDSYPILLTGSDPEAMSPTPIETYAPCVSKRGAVDVGGGMIYPANDGLWMANMSGVRPITQGLYRFDEFQELAPTSFDAAFHDGQYYAVHQPASGGDRQILVLDINELDSSVTVDDFAEALYRNDYDGRLYCVKGDKVLKWDADSALRYISEWRSVEVQLGRPVNLSVAQVHAAFSQVVAPDMTIPNANQVLYDLGPEAVGGFILGEEFLAVEVAGSRLQPYIPPTERKVQFVLYDGDTPVFSTLVTSSRPFRLPNGLKQEALRVGIGASVDVYSVTVAESTAELVQASQ